MGQSKGTNSQWQTTYGPFLSRSKTSKYRMGTLSPIYSSYVFRVFPKMVAAQNRCYVTKIAGGVPAEETQDNRTIRGQFQL